MITHYDFFISKPKFEIILKTWTHLLDLIFDLESLGKPMGGNLEGNNEISSQRTFSSISEESEEIEQGSEEKSEESDKNLEEKGRNSREKNKRNSDKMMKNSEDKSIDKLERSSDKSIDKLQRISDKMAINSEDKSIDKKAINFDDKLRKNSIDNSKKKSIDSEVEFEEKSSFTSSSTKAFLQNKLKRREVIQGKVLHEFSINSLDRQSLGSYSEMDHEEIGSLGDIDENRIKKQESLMKTKSYLLEESMKNFHEKNVFSSLMEVLCSSYLEKSREKSRENEIQNLLEKKDEFLFFNEEMFEEQENPENNCEDQQILVLLTKKNKEIFYVILEKLKLFFKKNPESPIFLNAFSANLSRNLAIIVKTLEILQVTERNFMLISPEFSSETNEYFLSFSCEILNFQCKILRYFTVESFRAIISEILDEILQKNQKFLLYIPIFTINSIENLHILKGFMSFANLNTIFSRKELKILMNKHRNHVELELFGFEQQLFIIANKFYNSLRFVIAGPYEKTKEIHQYFQHILKVFLRFNTNFLNDLHMNSGLECEISIEKSNKIKFFHVLEREFLHNFKDFHEFSMIKNHDIEKFIVKYLDGEIEKFIIKKLSFFKKNDFSGNLLEFLKKKNERFREEMTQLQEKNVVLLINIENSEKENLEIKEENEENEEKIEILKKKLENCDILQKENEGNIVELYEKNMMKKLEIIAFLRNSLNYDKEILENSFENSDIFIKISQIFPIFFQKSLEAENSLEIPLKLAIKYLGNQMKFIDILENFNFIDDFPRNQLEILVEKKGEISNDFSGNSSQKALIQFFISEIQTAIFERKNLIEKAAFSNDFRQIKTEIEEKSRIFEQNSLKISRFSLILSELVHKKAISEEILQRSSKNLISLENLITNLKEILNIALEQNLPYFSSEKTVEELRFSLILYIVFILKYPSFFRKILIQKTEAFFMINKEFLLFDYPIFSIFSDFSSEKLEKSAFSFTFLNILAIIEFLLQFEALSMLVIDPNGFFFEFFIRNKGNSLIIEEICDDLLTENNILFALEKGKILIIKDFNQKLLEMIEPILQWKFSFLMAKNDNSLYFTEENSKFSRNIMIFGKNVLINQEFRLVLLLQNEGFLKKFEENLALKRIVVIFADIEDKSLLEQAIAIKFSNKFNFIERKGLLDQLFQQNSFHFSNNESCYQEFLIEMKKINTIQEVSNLEKLKNCFLSIKSRFFEDFNKILRKDDQITQKSKEFKEIFREIKKTVQKNALQKAGLLMEIKEKSRYQSLIDFIHVIRLTNYSLLEIVGNIYQFSDGVYLQILEQCIANLQENSLQFNVISFDFPLIIVIFHLSFQYPYRLSFSFVIFIRFFIDLFDFFIYSLDFHFFFLLIFIGFFIGFSFVFYLIFFEKERKLEKSLYERIFR